MIWGILIIIIQVVKLPSGIYGTELLLPIFSHIKEENRIDS